VIIYVSGPRHLGRKTFNQHEHPNAEHQLETRVATMALQCGPQANSASQLTAYIEEFNWKLAPGASMCVNKNGLGRYIRVQEVTLSPQSAITASWERGTRTPSWHLDPTRARPKKRADVAHETKLTAPSLLRSCCCCCCLLRHSEAIGPLVELLVRPVGLNW
jgi:hypothetical protein